MSNGFVNNDKNNQTTMKSSAISRLIYLILLTTFVVRSNSQSNCGKRLVNHQGLITNGFPSNEGDWPWSAAIYHLTGINPLYKCGGTLISASVILTASHCVYEFNRPIISQRVLVSLGKFNLKISGTNAQEFQAHEIIPHPKYSTTDLSNDIAIIRLSTKATLNHYVQPVCLWESDKVSISEVTNKLGTVVGWGLTETDDVSVILREAVMPVVSHLTCLSSKRDFFGAFLSDKTFCAGFRNGTSVCNGDSGGSMTFEENGVYRIRGIVSLSVSRKDKNVCNSKEYVLFTDVAQYLSWIHEVVPELNLPSSVQTSGGLNFQESGNVRWTFNCDFYGGDIDYKKSRMEECGGICSANDRCTHFTWTTYDGGLCISKYFGTEVVASVLYDFTPICGWIVRPRGFIVAPPSQSLGFQLSGNVQSTTKCDYPGGDISNQKSERESCGEMCSANKACTHFTWTNYEDGLCLMKRFTYDVRPTALTEYDYTCGWIVRSPTDSGFSFQTSGNVRWSFNCNFNGNDIGNEKSSAEDCGRLCEGREECTHFNWTNLGTCWLKGSSGSTVQPNATRKYDGNPLCGMIVGRDVEKWYAAMNPVS